MISVSTPFEPKVHGFRFINCFDFPDLFKISSSILKFKSLSDIVYGLCGGMCYTALDYYRDHKPVSSESDVENISLKLFKHLWKRQLNTLSGPVFGKLLSWVLLDTKSLYKKTGQEEVKKIRDSIDSGDPCVLVLIYSRGILGLTQNHQVLATGYSLDPATNELAIQLYDPNYPGKTPALTMRLSKSGSVIKLDQSTGDKPRGFFKIEYEPVLPP